MTRLYGAAVFALTAAASIGAHEVGDFLVQSDSAAVGKQQPGRAGRKAMAHHVATYTATQLAAVSLATQATGLHIPARAILAGAAVNAATHWMIDRGQLLAWFAQAVGKADHAERTGFYYSGTGCSSGRAAMDQAAHRGFLTIAAAVTAAVARKITRR
jgi:hypothetical protein